MGSENPGKSWNFMVTFSRTGKSWKNAAGPVKLNKVITLFSLTQVRKCF